MYVCYFTAVLVVLIVVSTQKILTHFVVNRICSRYQIYYYEPLAVRYLFYCFKVCY